MKTTLHHYWLDISNPNEKIKYEKLTEQLQVTHAGKFFNALADPNHDRTQARNDSEIVELDERWLFDNQWNEVKDPGGRRLFDWYEAIYYNNGHKNERLKRGHWLEITPEMTAIRETTLTCGYCGKFVKASAEHKWHCEKCLDNEYLKEKDLGLLRLLPVACKNHKVSLAMTDDERAEIMPQWKEAQGLGAQHRHAAKLSRNRQKIAAMVPEAEAKAAKLISDAKIEAAANTWLMDREFDFMGNLIFYSHTQRFCFGWYKPLTDDEKSKLLDVLSEFPFDYDIK